MSRLGSYTSRADLLTYRNALAQNSAVQKRLMGRSCPTNAATKSGAKNKDDDDDEDDDDLEYNNGSHRIIATHAAISSIPPYGVT